MARWGAEKREAARRRLIAAARDELDAVGFDGMTLRTVAKRADLAIGTMFNYFPDKRSLLFAALFDDLEEVRRGSVESAPEDAGLRELLVHVAGRFFDYYAERPGVSRALLKESLFATGDAAVAFRAQVESVGASLATRIRKLQDVGRVRRDASPEHIVLAFIAHYYFVLLSELSDAPDPARMRSLIGALAEQLTMGVCPRDQESGDG